MSPSAQFTIANHTSGAINASVKDWEVIATNLSSERWSWGCIVSMDEKGRDIFVVQAKRDGKRFFVCADEKLTAFLELESAIRACGEFT
jgi:hypothetical protein